jgi:hypothetical protein
VLFEPVRKTQDAMFFFKADGDMWMPCGPKQPGAVQTTMQELASKGLAAKVTKDADSSIAVLREALPFELQRSSTTYLKDGF